MTVWRKPVSLEELALMKDDQIMATINEFLIPSNRAGAPVNPGDLVAAQFYMAELDRRNARLIERRRQEAETERDNVETRRHRVNLTIEIAVLILIFVELVFAAVEGYEQAGILSGLHRSSAATASILANLQASSMPNGLDATKISEMTLTVQYEASTQALLVTNLGPVEITLLGYKYGNGRGLETELGPHQAVPPGLTSSAVPVESALRMMGNYPKSTEEFYLPFRLRFRDRAGDEYLATTPLSFKQSNGSYEVSCGMTSILRFAKASQGTEKGDRK